MAARDRFCKASSINFILLGSLALIVIVLIVFSQVRNHSFLNFDTNVYVTENPYVKEGLSLKGIIWAFTSFHASNWHPITWLSHMADVHLFGMDPSGHHLTSVVIHAVSSVLLFLFLLRVSGARWQSLFVAALFALHPTHVESVAWVAERKDILSAFFCFLTLLLYAEYSVRRNRVLYGMTFGALVLGLMSKPMLITLPVVMLMMDYWPLGRFRGAREDQEIGQTLAVKSPLVSLLKEKIPFAVCAFAASVFTIFAQKSGGAIQGLEAVPFMARLENALVSYVLYISKIIWPDDLAVLYPLPDLIPLWQVIGSLLVLVLVSAATVRARHRSPYLAVGWAWYMVTLVPVIGIVQVGVQAMADRYAYIPSIGLFIMAAWGVPDLMSGLKHRTVILALLAVVVISAKTAVTLQQLGYWRDDITLYRQTLEVTDDNYVIHNNLGSAYAERWDLDAAIVEFREALRIEPDYEDAHYNLGMACAMKGDLDTAIRELREALRINPGNSKTAFKLGIALDQKRQLSVVGK